MQKFKKIKQSFMLASLMMASAWCVANNLGAADGYSDITDVYIISWAIHYIENEPAMQGEHLSKQHHQLTVWYGEQHEMEPGPGHHEY